MVDLDGTLLRGNSMKRLMRWLPKALWNARHPAEALLAIGWISLRGVRLVSHRRMKWHLGAIARRTLAPSDWNRFAKEELLPIVSTEVAAHIEALREKGAAVCVASAAMSEYVEPLCDILGYDHVLSTAHTNRFADYAELRGERKLLAINKLLAAGNYTLTRFLTDHSDDLPTATAYPEATILVNPSEKSAVLFAKAGISHKL